ncbi:MAG: lyase family protein, partial [Gammaproteobacteria bacterium]
MKQFSSNFNDAPNPGLCDPLFTTSAMRSIFSDRATVQAMLDFEAALAQAEGALGAIPTSAVAPIVAACEAARYDLEVLAHATATAGNPAIPLISALSAEVAAVDRDAAHWVHFGATSQDVIDTGRMLQLKQAASLLTADLARLKARLATLADAHRHTPMPGRTLLQHATPISFGLKLAGWLDAMIRRSDHLLEMRTHALALQLGGAVGNFAVLGERGLSVATQMGIDLALCAPTIPWHTQRDRIVEIGSSLAILIGALGKIARD